jgi:Serine carboxypeptidase S28
MTNQYGSIAQSDGSSGNGQVYSNGRASSSSSSKSRIVIAIIAVAAAVAGGYAYFNKSEKEEETESYIRDDDAHVGLTAEDIPEMYYDEQLIYHDQPEKGFFSQRYYEVKDYFKGPGHPLFIIMAGEDDLDEILYPFVWKTMGKKYGAYSINIEHRYYGAKGESWPLANPSNEDLMETLNTRIGLQDAVRMIKFKQQELGCGPRGSPTYCPVLTVGGSYPGFLAGLMRTTYPDVVDIGYASSAPFKLWSHKASTHAYFDHITYSAENASPGCQRAVKDALLAAQADILSSDVSQIPELAKKYGLCPDTIPQYMYSSMKMFSEELMESIASHFAEQNMGYYPPREWADLFTSCQVFQNENKTVAEKISEFILIGTDVEDGPCFDMTLDLPPYPNATVSASDWSGVGGGPSGVFWDFQCCLLMPECGFSEKSMFPHREWTLEWQTDHCYPRFGIKPDETALVREFKIDDFSNVTRLLFVNGLVDGWSAASYSEPEDDWGDRIKIVNILNGAHHSDLRQVTPNSRDTPDMAAAYVEIDRIVGSWLDEVKEENGITV